MDPSSATTILLVRHGHVPGIAPERFRGRTDIELTDRGVAEAHKTAEWIARFWRPTIVYTSPMKRCRDTGAAIAVQSHVNTEVLSSLNDLDYGEWQWQTHDEVAAKCPLLYRRWRTLPHLVRFPQGESLQELAARAADALRLGIDEHRAETIVMVGHDSVNRALLLQVLDQPLSAYWQLAQDPCAINEITAAPDRVVVVSMNETAHLRV
ncbi:MAG: histidine phosphatase family protein [Steroidobacteraceae bacterium]